MKLYNKIKEHKIKYNVVNYRIKRKPRPSSYVETTVDTQLLQYMFIISGVTYITVCICTAYDSIGTNAIASFYNVRSLKCIIKYLYCR